MNSIRILAHGCLLAALAPLATAQQGGTKEAPTTTTVQVKTVKLVRVGGDLVGKTLVTQKNEPLGKVEDVVIHPRGDVAFVEFLGTSNLNQGKRVWPVPWRALSRSEDGQFAIATTPEAFVKLPPYESGKRPKLDNIEWWTNVDKAYSSLVAEKASPVEASTSLAPAKALYLASDLRSRSIENPDGEKIATVHEVVVDPRAGRVAYVVLAVGGTAGTGEKMIAVPWDALKVMPDKANPKVDRLTLTTTREKLASAPEFQATDEGWTKASDPDYVVRVYEYYSVPLYLQVQPKKAPEPKQ